MPARRHTVPHDDREDIHSITEAQAPHSEGIDHRMKRYALQMGLRIVCLIVAVAFDGWIRWVAVVGVAVLPWIAVVLANGNDHAEVRDASYAPGATPRELIPGESYEQKHSGERSQGDEAESAAPRPDDDVIDGDVIDGEFRTGHHPDDRP